MHFKSIFVACAASLAYAKPAARGVGEVADAFASLTDVASHIIQLASAPNSVSFLVGIPTLLGDFYGLAENTASIFSDLGNVSDLGDIFNEEDKDKICDAAQNFIDESKDTIDSIVGNDDILGDFPFVDILTSVFQIVENLAAKLAQGFLDLSPCSGILTGKIASLTSAFQSRISSLNTEVAE